ncbi:hypothetical protein FKR81_00155 [Lentzea tibetensis]|uniref:Uncharacterized protein n=1 Tax=Lentzea tibetensis TaxID=2591470 RepID=A0A563F2I1_9PSEU|nr:hypothetical protein FKR81_00155 [Lentzea tibetensis]
MAKALIAGFQRIVHRARPVPVGSMLRVTRCRHFIAACSVGQCPRPDRPVIAGVERFDRVRTDAGRVECRRARAQTLTRNDQVALEATANSARSWR